MISGHDEVDHIGYGEAQTLIRHLQIEVERLARLVRKLHRWGFEQVHVVTDHGFVLLDEEKLPEEVPCQKEWCHVRKERFAMVPAEADIPLPLPQLEKLLLQPFRIRSSINHPFPSDPLGALYRRHLR